MEVALHPPVMDGKNTSRMYSDFFSRISAILVFAGLNVTFFPHFILGIKDSHHVAQLQ